MYSHLCIKMSFFLFVRAWAMPRILYLSCGVPFPVWTPDNISGLISVVLWLLRLEVINKISGNILLSGWANYFFEVVFVLKVNFIFEVVFIFWGCLHLWSRLQCLDCHCTIAYLVRLGWVRLESITPNLKENVSTWHNQLQINQKQGYLQQRQYQKSPWLIANVSKQFTYMFMWAVFFYLCSFLKIEYLA